MRVPTYLSYSALTLYEKDPEEYYLSRLSDTRAPRQPQPRPASIGSAFDARVKSSLHEALFGVGNDPRYSFEALFEEQVEEHNRDWALPECEYVFDSYCKAGQYDMLLELLERSDEPPRFEFDVKAEILGVPFLGKPDCRFSINDVPVIHDWKVNGYCSKYATSPTKGYMICNDGYEAKKQSRSHGKAHSLFVPLDFHGIEISEGYLEDYSDAWADQTTLYAWAMGEEIGSPVVFTIDQIVAKPLPEGQPLLRVATFRSRVRSSYQDYLAKRLTTAWQAISSGHIFQDCSREESDTRCRTLDDTAVALQGETGFFAEVCRAKYRG